jgi:hypothetical protein
VGYNRGAATNVHADSRFIWESPAFIPLAAAEFFVWK